MAEVLLQERQAAGQSILLHYMKVNGKARTLVPQCRMYVAAASEAKTTLAAVQLSGIVSAYGGKVLTVESEVTIAEIVEEGCVDALLPA